jgi:hypothetical protein
MARKPIETATGTIKTRIGVLTGGEVIALESVGRDMYLTVGGARIARRAVSARKGVRSWIPLSRAWLVTDIKDPIRKLEIRRNGRPLEWTPL